MPMTFAGKPNVSGPPTGADMDIVASHQRLLIGAALRTTGPILELGVGWYSTPLLHEIAEVQGRPLVTVDNNKDWLSQFKPLENENHSLQLVGWWGEFFNNAIFERWGLVFVDQGQPIEREYAIRSLLESCKVEAFVMHDTEEGFAYGYNRILPQIDHLRPEENRTWDKENIPPPMFKYQFTDRTHRMWTTVASNSVDVSKWFKEMGSAWIYRVAE